MMQQIKQMNLVILILCTTLYVCTNSADITRTNRTTPQSDLIQLVDFNSTKIYDTRSLCPKDWHYFNHHCYYFVNHEETWFQSELNCRQNDSHLVSILTEDESKFVQSVSLCHNDVWIGLVVTQSHNDLWKSSVGWSWWDGEEISINKFQGDYNLANLCRYAHYVNRIWYQNVCYGRIRSVCKKKSLKPTFSPYLENPSISEQPISMRCPNNWTYFEGKCYKFFNQEVNYLRADIHCRDLNGYLVTIDNDQQQAFLQHQFGCGVKFWIGLQRMTPCSQKPLATCWEWMDRSELIYENWQDNTKEHDCVHSRGKWFNTVSCESKLYYACYRNVVVVNDKLLNKL